MMSPTLVSSLFTLQLNVYRRHPNSSADRPLIDYEVLMMFAPYLMLSISAGVTLNGIMPAWIITLLLVRPVPITITFPTASSMLRGFF
jgi:hypothetical protein